jgi:hypothetical protein
MGALWIIVPVFIVVGLVVAVVGGMRSQKRRDG